MKVVKTLILLVVLGLGLAYAVSQAVRSELTSLLHLSRDSQLLGQLEDSNLLPPPLRSAIDAHNALLTQAGTLKWTNYQRTQNGAQPLALNPILNKAAANKLADMFAQQYFEHVSPSGVGPADVAKDAGYAYVVVGENLALGNFADDEALVTAWMNSPGHRENILNDRYEEIGIAVGKGMFEGREVWLAVQSFGRPLSSCPAVDEILKQQLEQNQARITQLQAQLEVMRTDLEKSDRNNSKQYNAKVEQYNALVDTLNTLIAETKAIVQQYNTQVNSFNACLKK